MIDLDMINGDLRRGWVKGKTEVAQRVKTRIGRVQGEWFIDRTLGLPWYSDTADQLLGVRDVSYMVMTAQVVALGTVGVDSVNSLTYDYNKRLATVKMVLNIDDSLTPLQIEKVI